MEPNKESSQPQAGTQQSSVHRKKDDITPKIGQREAYRAYDSSPFDPYEKSKLFQEDFINNRVEQRMRMQEKAAENMDQGISNKDKFITRKGQEQFYFHGNMENYYIKKTQDKYNKLQKQNEGYKVTKDQEDKYFKNYVDNAKPTTLDQIDQELYENEGKRLNKQQQYNKALNDQINSNRAMKNRFETDYKKRLDDAKRIEDEKYYKEQKIKEDNRIKSKNDFVNTNQRLIDQKNEAKKFDYNQNVEFDNKINDKVKKQMDYMEEKEYRRKEDKKNRYKQALDKQVNQQKIRRKREYDIEHGNF
jgi:hypothetical protein